MREAHDSHARGPNRTSQRQGGWNGSSRWTGPGVALIVLCVAGFGRLAGPAAAQDFRVLEETRPSHSDTTQTPLALPTMTTAPRVLLAGDSWAQYMWDDGSHNDIFDRFGEADHLALSSSLGSDPGPGYDGPEYAISGSEARQWVDTANYPWIANMVAALEANPTIETVLLSIGGNDILAAKSGGGWYKDMDLDNPGSEAAFFDQLEQNTLTIIDAALAVRPNLTVVISSYDYPNFNVGFWCFLYACPKRRDLSRDPDNDLITDQEINAMMVNVEGMRIGWAAAHDRVLYDNSVGLMHYFYGDGVSGPRVLPRPGLVPPLYLPFPGGNPLLPTLRINFRQPGGIDADPIHLNYDGYQYKIAQETEGYFFPVFRGTPTATFLSQGGSRDGWTNGTTTGTDGILVGDDGSAAYRGIVSFDTSEIPDGATVTSANLYLLRDGQTGTNPFTSGLLGTPQVDVARGSFGNPDLEPSDATAPADAVDAGIVNGSVRADRYAIRVELTPDGLAAVNDAGTTQLRLYFPLVDPGGTPDAIHFRDGDSGEWPSDGLPSLADLLGTSAPFLDVVYETPTGVASGPERVSLRLHSGQPNPFRVSTSLRFDLPAAARVSLAVFDAAGRRVRSLVSGPQTPGTHAAVWDGRDDAGHEVASGLYLARLEAGGQTQATRLVRLAGE